MSMKGLNIPFTVANGMHKIIARRISEKHDLETHMCDVMLDLETMGNGPNAAIVAIGAVAFNPSTNSIDDKFYTPVDLESSVKAGGVMDPSTVLWWMQQSDAARSLFSKQGIPLETAIKDFSCWLGKIALRDDIRMWGNGSDFDNVILSSAYRSLGIPLPWNFWSNRCYRSIKSLHPEIKMQRTGTHHNALNDAESQALHLMAILNAPEVEKTPCHQ